MKNLIVPAIAMSLLPGLPPLAAQAQNSPVLPPAQSRTFALAFTLRACDLRAQDYIEAVKSLKTIDDNDAANAQVKNRSRETPKLRRAQSEAYTQSAQMLARMGAPTDLHTWASETATRFKAPLVYDNEAKKLAKTEPDAGKVLAELAELETVNAAGDAQRPTIAFWLKLTGGPLAIWTADVGSYAADLRRAAAMPGQSRLLGRAALRLLLKAPPDAPTSIRGDLSELAPRDGGNLKNLETVLPDATPREQVRRVYAKLVDDYNARKQAAALDKAE